MGVGAEDLAWWLSFAGLEAGLERRLNIRSFSPGAAETGSVKKMHGDEPSETSVIPWNPSSS